MRVQCLQRGAPRPLNLPSPYSQARTPSEGSRARCDLTHTTPDPHLGHSVTFHPSRSRGVDSLPSPPPASLSNEKCPRPSVFLLLPRLLGPFLFPFFLFLRKRTHAQDFNKPASRKQTQPPSQLQRHSLGPCTHPRSSRTATAVQGSARPGLPTRGSHRSLTQEAVKQRSGFTNSYGGGQPCGR